MTVAALLPQPWNKRLIDTNVECLRDSDLAWADVALISGMHIQQEDLVSIVQRCRARGLRTVVGSPRHQHNKCGTSQYAGKPWLLS